MLIKKYAAPCRVDYVPSPYEPDEDGVMDVGYKTGTMSDGRTYRLECWRMDEMLMLTVLFPNEGLSAYSRADMPFCTLWALASHACRLRKPPTMWAIACGP